MRSQSTQRLRHQGRTDSRRRLQDRLPSAAPIYAEGALSNPALDVSLVEVMLRNPSLQASFLSRVARQERLRACDGVKRGLVQHPATPTHHSMNLVRFLDWRELLSVANDRQLPQPLRAMAERLLGERLSQLPVGEKGRLARSAGRAVLKGLLRSRDLSVVQELLRNPRLTEMDMLPFARDRATPSVLLELMARSPRWTGLPKIRQALVENVATPIPIATRLLQGLPSFYLKKTMRNIRLAAPVREAARRQMDLRGTRVTGGSAGAPRVLPAA